MNQNVNPKSKKPQVNAAQNKAKTAEAFPEKFRRSEENIYDNYFQQTHFFNTVAALTGLHEDDLPEIAFVGRSNAGKSSTINTLTLQNRLAYVSKMPGRTQHLNFFEVTYQKQRQCYLVDLPGYGFSQASKNVEQNWEEFLSVYLQTRLSVKGLVMVMDIRRPLTALDEYLIQWFLPTGKPIHIILNKCDKIGHQAQQNTIFQLKQNLKTLYHADVLEQVSMQLFSAERKKYHKELVAKLRSWVYVDNNIDVGINVDINLNLDQNINNENINDGK